MNLNNFDEIFKFYDQFKDLISIRLREFSTVPLEEYFWELCYCLLTPSTRANNASKVVTILKEKNFYEKKFNPVEILRNPNHYIRFHNVKSLRLLNLVNNWNLINKIVITKNNTPQEIRKKLVETVEGLGMKEASHFLRNVGFTGLAVLDRHILKNLHYYGLIESKKTSIASVKKYLEIEEKFKNFSTLLGLSMEELDLLFWAKETGFVLK